MMDFTPTPPNPLPDVHLSLHYELFGLCGQRVEVLNSQPVDTHQKETRAVRTIQRRSKWFNPPKRPQRLRRPLIAHGHSTSTHTTNDQTSREETERPSHRNRLPGNGRSEICCHTPNRPMSSLTLHRPTQINVPWSPTSRPPKQNNTKQHSTSRLFPAGESPTATRQPEAKPKIVEMAESLQPQPLLFILLVSGPARSATFFPTLYTYLPPHIFYCPWGSESGCRDWKFWENKKW